MKFLQFLKESEDQKNENTLTQLINMSRSLIEKNSKQMKIYPVKEIFLIDYKNKDEDVNKDDLVGYFIYKNELGEQDDYYIGKFLYHIKSQKIDILTNDIKDSFSTISDTETYITSNLKGHKID